MSKHSMEARLPREKKPAKISRGKPNKKRIKSGNRRNPGLTSKNILDAITDQMRWFKSDVAKWAFVDRIHNGIRQIIGIR